MKGTCNRALIIGGALVILILLLGCSSNDGGSGDNTAVPYRMTSVTLYDSENTVSRSDDTVLAMRLSFPTGDSALNQFNVEIQSDQSDPPDGDYDDLGERWTETFVNEDGDSIGNVVTYEMLDDDGLYDDKTVSTYFTNGAYGYLTRTTEFDSDHDGAFGDSDGDDDTRYRVRTYTAGRVTLEAFYYNPGNLEVDVANYTKWMEKVFSYDAEGRLTHMTIWLIGEGVEGANLRFQDQTYTYSNGRLTEIYTECDRDRNGSLETTGTSYYQYNSLGLVEYGYFNWAEEAGARHLAGYFEWEEGDCIVRGEAALMSINTEGFFCFSNSLGGDSPPEPAAE